MLPQSARTGTLATHSGGGCTCLAAVLSNQFSSLEELEDGETLQAEAQLMEHNKDNVGVRRESENGTSTEHASSGMVDVGATVETPIGFINSFAVLSDFEEGENPRKPECVDLQKVMDADQSNLTEKVPTVEGMTSELQIATTEYALNTSCCEVNNIVKVVQASGITGKDLSFGNNLVIGDALVNSSVPGPGRAPTQLNNRQLLEMVDEGGTNLGATMDALGVCNPERVPDSQLKLVQECALIKARLDLSQAQANLDAQENLLKLGSKPKPKAKPVASKAARFTRSGLKIQL